MYLLKANFKDIPRFEQQWFDFFSGDSPNLIFLDLGVSSPQLDEQKRGFSFYNEGPLDMRMDQDQDLTAYEIVNTWSEQELSDLFYHVGEVKFPNKVVRNICASRKDKPIETTTELSDLIIKSDGCEKKVSILQHNTF